MSSINGDYTTLLLFSSSEAEDYTVYRAYGKEGNERNEVKNAINSFIADIDGPYDNCDRDNSHWKICYKPRMVLAETIFRNVSKERKKLKELMCSERKKLTHK